MVRIKRGGYYHISSRPGIQSSYREGLDILVRCDEIYRSGYRGHTTYRFILLADMSGGIDWLVDQQRRDWVSRGWIMERVPLNRGYLIHRVGVWDFPLYVGHWVSSHFEGILRG